MLRQPLAKLLWFVALFLSHGQAVTPLIELKPSQWRQLRDRHKILRALKEALDKAGL